MCSSLYTIVACHLFYMYVSDKKAEKVYTSARKQMLISALPPVVTLHLKRFHQVRILSICIIFCVILASLLTKHNCYNIITVRQRM